MQGEISQKKNDCLIGEKQEVLVEGPSRKNIKMYTGRTRQNRIAIFSGF
ncbi:MAG: TRAM domain-containing protein [Candidatus Aureabacteria bacterium]|nr:TRAM domain-containing protein [Candidatus Auribacterota bacterium]